MPTMTLEDTQRDFARFVPLLLGKARTLDYEVIIGPTTKSLMLSLTLYRGKKRVDDHEAYEQLGAWWESKSGIWGGRTGMIHTYAWPSQSSQHA